MAARKLQTEIDRVFKKISDGVVIFDEMFHAAMEDPDTGHSDKIQADLKAQIKKLQRLRDQIKSWQGNSDIRDQSALNERRRTIEERMEAFKDFERDAKTKAYSKEGLAKAAQEQTLSPEQEEAVEWLEGCLEIIKGEMEELEEKIESSRGRNRKRRGNADTEELDQLMEQHKLQDKYLSASVKAVKDGSLPADLIEEIKDSVDYYLEAFRDPDFFFDEYMYEPLGFEEKPDGSLFMPNDMADQKKPQISSLADLAAEESAVTTAHHAADQTAASLIETVTPDAVVAATVGKTDSKKARQEKEKREKKERERKRKEEERKRKEEERKRKEEERRRKEEERKEKERKEREHKERERKERERKEKERKEKERKERERKEKERRQQEDAAAAAAAAAAQEKQKRNQNSKAQAHRQDQGKTSKKLKINPTVVPVQATGSAATQQPVSLADANAQAQAADTARLSVEAMLDQSFHSIPAPGDTAGMPSPPAPSANPCPTPAYYPQTVPAALNNPALFDRLHPNTLFSAFYFQQGTYQQYLAARALKRQSWRFHKKYLTWFQRHDEPKLITDELEEGTYVFFDYDAGWRQRKEQDFTFKYRYLEDDPVV